MDRKTIAAIVLSVGVVWFWTKYVMIPLPGPERGGRHRLPATVV